MSDEKIIKCAKCRQDAHKPEYNKFQEEYKKGYQIRSKDGIIYCWDCYKSISHCKFCQKSVANVKFKMNNHENWSITGYSQDCERIENKVEFICSKECLNNFGKAKVRKWKEKLNQGWQKCEECVKLFGKLLEEHSDVITNKEMYLANTIKLLPAGEKAICDNHKEYEKGGYYHRIAQKAQKHWDSLSYKEKLAEVKRTDGVGMAKFYGKEITAEELAKQEKAPRSIYEDFVHNQKCCTCGEEPCKLMKKNKNNNSANANNLACAASSTINSNEIKSAESEQTKLEKSSSTDIELASQQQLEVAQKAKTAAEQKLNSSNIAEINSTANNNFAKSQSNNHIFLIIGGLFLTGSVLVIGYLLGKNKK